MTNAYVYYAFKTSAILSRTQSVDIDVVNDVIGKKKNIFNVSWFQ